MLTGAAKLLSEKSSTPPKTLPGYMRVGDGLEDGITDMELKEKFGLNQDVKGTFLIADLLKWLCAHNGLHVLKLIYNRTPHWDSLWVFEPMPEGMGEEILLVVERPIEPK